MRNSIKYLGGISALALAATGSAAQAQTVTAQDLAAMKAQMAQLQSQIDALEAESDAQGQAVADAQARAAAAEAKAAQAGGPKVSWKGAPEFEGENGWSFKPRGRLQYDIAHVGKPENWGTDKGLGFSNELRRGRIGVQGDMPGGFGYKFEIDFADSGVDITDAFISYQDEGLTLTAGQQNNFQSLSELTSSLDESFMERAAFTDAFGFERRVGLGAQYASGPFLGQIGVFTSNIDDLTNDEDDTIGVSGRVVFAPKLGETTQLHLGASAHYRDLGDTVTSVRYRQRPMIHTTDTRFIDTGNIPAESETNYGLEAAVISGRFHAAAEGHWQNVNIPFLSDDASFFGGYAEVGYFLTDNTRGYKGGVFKGPKVGNSFDKGGSGAIQLVARYDYLDLEDDDLGFNAGQQNAYEFGVSWWPIDYVRLMANYGHIEYDDTFFGNDYSSDVIAGRFQVSF